MKRIAVLFGLVLTFLSLAAQQHIVRREGRLLAHGLKFNPDHITNDMPEALQELLRSYQTQPRYAERTKGRAVAPLLKSVRSQYDPHNGSCPFYTDDSGQTSEERCVTGCVATCIEQVLSYYRYPEALLDTLKGWTTDHYSISDVMPGTPIDWDNIIDDYRGTYSDAQAKAVADLTLYCGMAAYMNWGLSSSSANLGRAFEPLWKVFGYETVVYLPRAMYSSPKWNAMLRNELENGRPICYTGHNMALSGHAFNIDGVDEDGYYHLNWGYGGKYDGYYDLDYLNPYEQIGDMTDLGQQEGHFSNQTAMFLYPQDIDIDIHDSLTTEDAFAGVTVEKVVFRRPPDTQYYTIADFTMKNTTRDSLNFTFEVLTYLPTDTAIFMQADYVGLTTVNLAPGESRTWPVYCQFHVTGERIFAFSADDETLPFQIPVNVVQGTIPRLTYGDIKHKIIKDNEGLSAELTIEISNEATDGYAGNLVTFCLFPEDGTPDYRHWDVLALPGGETYQSTTRFLHLQDGMTYTLKVRCPWIIRKEYTFTVKSEDATSIEEVENEGRREGDDKWFDITGRKVSRPVRGIYIKNGKKYLMR